MAKYDLALFANQPHKVGGGAYEERVTVEGAKAAAREAVAIIRRSQGEVRRVDIVPPGADPLLATPLMVCARGQARSEAARDRERRLTFERRGYTRTVRCDVFSSAFKRELTKKAPKRRRKAR